MDKWASNTGTEKYFQWVDIHPDKKRVLDGLHVSALGCGTYMGPADDATDRLYEQSLLRAGLSGVNVFDTAINYRCMRSEKILQKVIKELAHQGIARNQIVICTKGGYLPFEGAPGLFEEYVRTHYLDTGLISSGEIIGGCHCMSGAYLEHQIAISLRNLGIESLDLYYLHNPEIQLAELGEEPFYERLTEAFQLFERKVEEKKIQRYGIATWNGFRQKSTQKNSLKISRLLECAVKAGGEGHHFRAVQVPYNLVMLEVIKNKTIAENDKRKTLLRTLQEFNLAVMVSSPLMQSQITQLTPRAFEKLPKEESPILQALQFVASTPGVCSLLAGIKHPEHWRENSKLLQLPDWSFPEWSKAASALGVAPERPA